MYQKKYQAAAPGPFPPLPRRQSGGLALPDPAAGRAERSRLLSSLVADESGKGEEGNAAILAGADGMVREVLGSVLRHAPDPTRAETALAQVTGLRPGIGARERATRANPEVPRFGEVAADYIRMRQYWPRNATKTREFAGLSTRAILAANRVTHAPSG